MSTPLNVLGISGSLRKGSYNTAALRAAAELAPPGMAITLADISELPLYNDDIKARGWPAPVARFRDAVRAADALLIATPEYNYSVSSPLKNAIDWASRPPEQPFAGKPAAILGASPGAIGTARAQYHLRQIAVFLDLKLLNKPEVMIGNCTERFDADLKLSDAKTREFLQGLLVALRDWTLQLRQ